MEGILRVVQDTPTWVWAILIYVIFMGMKATSDRVISIPKLFIVPIILIALKFNLFFSENILAYVMAILLGSVIGYYLGYRTPIKMFKDLKSVGIPGEYSTLILLLLFFLLKYIFGFLNAVEAEMMRRYVWVEISMGGLLVGYFLGRSLCYFYRFVKSDVQESSR